jgi:hypothetical protein
MVAEGGDGIFGGGETVRVGGGADGGVAYGCGVEAEEGVLAEADIVEGSDLHEEVVGCWPSMMGLPKAVSPCWKSSGIGGR